jgi:flavorubredoxin
MLAECFVDTLLASGVEVASYDVARTDLGEIAQELVDTRAIVVVAPTVLGTIHPIMEHMLNILKLLRPPAKYGALLSSKGWSGGAVQRGTAMLKAMGLEVVGIVDCVGVPTYKDLEATKTIARQLAEKIQQ